MKILLIEDDVWLKDCYINWLNHADFTVLWASSAQQALDLLDNSRCELIILDIFLPNANGVQFLNVLASHSDFMNIPVVILSTQPPAHKTVKAYGVKEVLDKTSVTNDQLIKAIKNALL
jgi:DNA-binding response OmpR family regulator